MTQLELQKKKLKESMKHWEENRRRTPDEIDIRASACACCVEWYMPWGASCEECPIAEYTGNQYCEGTPYFEVERLLEDLQDSYDDDERAKLELPLAVAIEAECEFLQKVYNQLLEKEE